MCACMCSHTHSEKLVSLLSCPLGPFSRDNYSFTVCVYFQKVSIHLQTELTPPMSHT